MQATAALSWDFRVYTWFCTASDRNGDTCAPPFGYQTIETMVPKEMEFPRESQAGERERPKAGGTCLPEQKSSDSSEDLSEASAEGTGAETMLLRRITP